MVRGIRGNETKQPARLTQSQMKLGVQRLKKRILDLEAFDPRSITNQFQTPELKAIAASIDASLVDTFGGDTLDYERYKNASRLSTGSFYMGRDTPLHQVHEAVARSKESSLALMNSAIRALEERSEENSESNSEPSAQASPLPSRKVFIVHGHDDGAREAVARFLEQIGFDPIILHEQANRGRTVIEKVEDHGSVGFAVILLTPDDEGRAKSNGELEPRARQNVLLELGYFIGRLQRKNVCALKRGELEIPSDFAGIVWNAMDDSGGWKLLLARELQAAGHQIDWNKVMR